MKISFIFHPFSMLSTVHELREQYGPINANLLSDIADKNEAFLRIVATYSDEQAAANAYDLSVKELHILAGYIGGNKFKLNIRPIAKILSIRKGKTLISEIYNSWKHNCEDRAVVSVIDFYISDDNYTDTFIEQYDLDPALWSHWTRSSLSVCEQIAKDQIDLRSDINELAQYGIFNTDPLYHAVKSARLFYCDQNEYNRYSVAELIKQLRVFTQEQQHRFLQNFLSKVTERGYLLRFNDLCKWFSAQYKFDKSLQKCSPFWKNASENEIKAFHRWQLICNISLAFGQDERSVYWVRYVDSLEEVYTVPIRGKTDQFRIAMVFPSFVVVDFTEIGFAARVISREYYKKDIAKYFEIPLAIKNNQLRDKLPKSKLLGRVNHHSGWQFKTDQFLRYLMDEGSIWAL